MANRVADWGNLVMSKRIADVFEARAPDGTVHCVLEYRQAIDTGSLGGRSSIQGLPQFKLEDGRAVNRIDDDTFKIVGRPAEKLKRIR
jgi:hypothetical protein